MSKRYPGVRTIRRGAVYEISFYPYRGAKRRQFRIQAGSEREAHLTRAQFMQEQSTCRQEKLSFSEIKERLRLKCQADGNSPKTVVNLLGKYRNLFEVFLPKYYPGITDISQISRPIIERYKQFVVVDQGRPDGWRDELTKLKSIFSKMIEVGICRREIYEDVLKRFKRPKRRLKVYKDIGKGQMKRLLEHIKQDRPYFYGPTYMIMRLGWRRGQVLALKRKNVKLHGFRPVQVTCEPQDTKNKEPFILRGIDDELADIIRMYLTDGIKTPWLFPNRKGKSIHANNYTSYISKVSKEVLGIRLSPHSFRHCFCTQRLREGAVERDIMAITGHKDPESFRIYVHATSEGTRKVLERSRLY